MESGITVYTVNEFIDRTLEETQKKANKFFLKTAMWKDYKDVGYEEFNIHMLELYRDKFLSGMERQDSATLEFHGEREFSSLHGRFHIGSAFPETRLCFIRVEYFPVTSSGELVLANVTLLWRDIKIWGEQWFFNRARTSYVQCVSNLTIPAVIRIRGPDAGQSDLVTMIVSFSNV